MCVGGGYSDQTPYHYNSHRIGSNPRDGSRISGKGVHMYKGVGVALLILSHFP